MNLHGSARLTFTKLQSYYYYTFSTCTYSEISQGKAKGLRVQASPEPTVSLVIVWAPCSNESLHDIYSQQDVQKEKIKFLEVSVITVYIVYCCKIC